MANCTAKQVQTFVRYAENCLVKDMGSMESSVLETLGSDVGVEILRNLFGPTKNFVLKQTTSNAQVRDSCRPDVGNVSCARRLFFTRSSRC